MHDKTHKDDKSRLISLSEAAKQYGFSPDYLRNLAQKGRINAQKIGHIWTITPNDMEVYILSRKHMGAYRDDIQLS
ncbi:MAG: helix-turn-helix domain-containing protein [Anaerolineales bacterium]|nr:helix-turn-helix domain-containing protein [Anaerolineales bacterium]MCA9933361.1 helix-turn-helix domain-containing protein [Anaerolineales bacterium]